MEDQKIFIRFPFGPGLSPYLHQLKLYTTCLKNWFLTASAFSQNSHLHSRLVHAQWSLVPDQNFEKPSCQIPNFSNTFGIYHILTSHDLKKEKLPKCIKKYPLIFLRNLLFFRKFKQICLSGFSWHEKYTTDGSRATHLAQWREIRGTFSRLAKEYLFRRGRFYYWHGGIRGVFD